MRVALLSLVLLVVLGGCLDPTNDMDTGETTEDEPSPFVAVRALISEERGGPEPSLGVTPDGVFFTNLYSSVYRSSDDGVTWEQVAVPNPDVPNFDPDLAVDADGTVWESRLYIACSAVASSQDQGKTWTENPAVCETGPGDRQYVIPLRDGEAYIYLHQLPAFYQTVAHTTDYGATWTPLGPAEFPDHAFFAAGHSGWGGGGFWNEATGSVFFTYSWNGGAAPQLLPTQYPSGPGFSVKRGDSLTFTHQAAAAYDGRTLGLALVTGDADEAGNVYLTWGESYDGDVAIYVAGSQDDGRTWTAKQRIDPDPTGKVFPVLTAGADGHVAVAYYEANETAFPDDVNGTWNVTLSWTDDFFGNGSWQKARLNDEPVKEGPICISGTTCSGNREFADYFDAVTTPDGRVAVTYNRLIDDRLRNEFALTTDPILQP